MGVEPDSSQYGSQTVAGPGWPNVDEDALAAAAATFEEFAAKLTGSVVPLQQEQLTKLAGEWEGGGSQAAAGEASSIIGGHEANAAHAAAIAGKLRSMEATVAKTKTLVNATAEETQLECEALSAQPFGNTQELVESRVKLGLSQNIADVTANTTELAGVLGVAPNLPKPGAPPAGPAQQAAEKGGKEAGKKSQQGMQSVGQAGSMVGQLVQQIGQMMNQGTQQLTQPLQQLAQPLQQLTSMLGQGGKGGSGGSPAPFPAFSSHPLAGGLGKGGGAGLVHAASVPGSGGVAAQTPLMAKLVGNSPVAVAGAAGAAGGGVAGGVAPVAGGGMGAPGAHGERGESGGTRASLAVPAPLDYDLGDGDPDDDW